MGAAEAVEVDEAVLDRRVDPGLVTLGAAADDLRKSAVACDFEAAGTERLAQGLGQAESVDGDNGAAAWLDPEDVGRIAAVGHREHADGISAKQQIGIDDVHPHPACAEAGGEVNRLEDFAHPLLRTTEAHAFGGLHQRPLDQDRIGDHGVEDRFVADRAVD